MLTLVFYHQLLKGGQSNKSPHRDDNNLWRVLNATVDSYNQYDYEHKPIIYIEHDSRIKLRHIVTDKALHSHDVRPPVSDVDFPTEISDGMTGFVGDINDDWAVEIEQGDSSRDIKNTFKA